MKTLKAKWTGIRPLIMHNGLLADPTNEWALKIKEICKKGSKKLTKADYEERDKCEWIGSLYWDDQIGPVIPSDNIERCIQLGAQKSRLGKEVKAAVFVSEYLVKLNYIGPRDMEALFKDRNFTIRKGVVVTTSRIIRIRPVFQSNAADLNKSWSIQFTVEYDESIINESDLKKAMEDAGALIGLGDWRPKFGRFVSQIL